MIEQSVSKITKQSQEEEFAVSFESLITKKYITKRILLSSYSYNESKAEKAAAVKASMI